MTYGVIPQEDNSILADYEGDTYREKLADYGLKQMAGFNYNLGDMAIDTKRILGADQESKEAFVYMLDQYDQVNTSWYTAKQAGWEMLTDITNWAGVATLGAGAVASQTAKLAMKTATREAVKASIKAGSKKLASTTGINTSVKRAGALGAVEGGLHAGLADSLEQTVRIDAGQQDEYNLKQTMAMTGVGVVGGAVLGSGLDYGLSKLTERAVNKRFQAKFDAVRKEIEEKGVEAERKLVDAENSATTPMARKIETGQSVDGVTFTASSVPDPMKPPRELLLAKVNYNYGQNNPINLVFEDELSKALFIVGKKGNPAKHFNKYMQYLQSNGVTNISKQARELRESIKAQAKNGAKEVNLNSSGLTRKAADGAPTKKVVDEIGDAVDPRPPKPRVSPRIFYNSTDLLQGVKDGKLSIDKVLNDLETERYTAQEWSDIKSIVNGADDLAGQEILKFEGLLTKNLSEAQRKDVIDQLEGAFATLNNTTMMREHVNAYSGRDLQDIQNYMTFRREAGEEVTEKMVNEASAKVYKNEMKKIDEDWNSQINEAYKKNTPEGLKEAFELTKKRESDPYRNGVIHELDKLDPEAAKKFKDKDPASYMDRMLELQISGVFSPSTIAYNTVFPFLKNYSYPFIDNVMQNPLDLMRWRKTIRQYGAMMGAQSAAMKAARAAAAYEQTLLTRDENRFLEGGIKNKFFGASWLRAYPRLLGATDAYNQEVASTGVLAAEAFDFLATQGAEKGLKGKALHKYIDDNIKKEIDNGYDKQLTYDKVRPLYEKAAAKGLTGDKLEKYITDEINITGAEGFKTLGNKSQIKSLRDKAKELKKERPDPELKPNEKKAFREEKAKEAQEVLNEADRLERMGKNAQDAVEELLYKKDFDKTKGGAEKLAGSYEDFTRGRPWTKVIGNLFFRTPAWLFHESLRLTPAINSMLPQFRNDLAGNNGAMRQARAQTEAAVAYAWMLYTVTKWSQGEMTGNPDKDYTKTGERNKSTMRPLTIKDPFFLDGDKEVSFARWEPLRIPATVAINVLDGFKDYHDKKNMDGFDESDGVMPDYVMAGLGVAYATAISAFKDSALTQGATDTIGTGVRIFDSFADPDAESTQGGFDLFTDWATKKGTMVIPSSIKKGQEAFFGDDELTSLRTPKDRLIATVAPNHDSLSRKYDILGNVMKREQPLTQITGFGYATPEGLAAGRTDNELKVLDFVAKLEDLGFGNLTRVKYRDARFGKKDLRSINTTLPSGQVVSVYDAMMIEVQRNRKLLVKGLLPLVDSDLPLGSPRNSKTHGLRVKLTKEAITNFRNEALDRVIMQDRQTGGTLIYQTIERDQEDLQDSMGIYESRL